MRSKLSGDELIFRERRRTDTTFAIRKSFDFAYAYLRSCAVCGTALPPVDLLCGVCWREFGRVMNRGQKLRQADYVFPTYSLLTWTPETEYFVKPFIYGFKGGRTIRAAEKLAMLFLSEREPDNPSISIEPFVVSAPSKIFDHSRLWARQLASLLQTQEWPLLADKLSGAESQKELRQGERANRRYEVREHFAKYAEASKDAKRIVFADDVITSGSTAMAAYMALGDPDRFEVWTIVARPRLAGK